MQSSVLCGVRVNMMERRPLVAIGRKATDRIRDSRHLKFDKNQRVNKGFTKLIVNN